MRGSGISRTRELASLFLLYTLPSSSYADSSLTPVSPPLWRGNVTEITRQGDLPVKINLPLLLSIYRRGFAINKRLTIGGGKIYPRKNIPQDVRPSADHPFDSSAASTDLTPSTKVITPTFRFFTPRLRLVPAEYPLLNDFEVNKGNCHRFVANTRRRKKKGVEMVWGRKRERRRESLS